MEEIWFRLSSQLEALQNTENTTRKNGGFGRKVQASVGIHHAHQWILAWSEQCQQFFQELQGEQYLHYANEIIQRLLVWLKRTYGQFQLHYYNHLRPTEFYHKLGNWYTHEVSKREVIFWLASMTIGFLIGYYADCKGRYFHSPKRHQMSAVICHDYIGIEGALIVEDAEKPIIERPNDVLIRVHAVSVNVIDAKICSGYSRMYRRLLNSGKHKDLPVTLGRDCTGVVQDIGECVMNFDLGDEVFLAVPSWAHGTMSEYIVAPETHVVKRPKQLHFVASAALPYNGCLAWDALVNRSVIKKGNAKGKRVLICGGNTPVGFILIQLVKLWGGHVTTICRQQVVCLMKSLRVDEVIVSDTTDVMKELQLHDKFHAIFYTGGEPMNEWAFRKRLKPFGTYTSTVPQPLTSDSLGLICGCLFASYVRIKLLVQYVFGYNINHLTEDSKINATYLEALCDIISAGELQVVMDKVYRPHNIKEALNHVLDPDATGSTIIIFKDD